MDNACNVHLKNTFLIMENVSPAGQSIITVLHALIQSITVQCVMYNSTQFLENVPHVEISSKVAPHVYPNSHVGHVVLTYTYSILPVSSVAVVMKSTLIARSVMWEGVCNA